MEMKGKAGSAAVDNASSDRTADDAPAQDPAEDDGQGNEEGRIIKGQKKVVSPGREEWDNHMRTHIPYRKWCPHCVRAKRKSAPHRERR